MPARITPWRDTQEWELVKQWFYPRGGPDNRQLALNRVKAWTVRGRIPHSVQSTAWLTASLIRSQSGILDATESRLMLSIFVNGLLDPGQQAVYALPMLSLARQIDLPEVFVEVRHSATHDTLPSLPVLEDTAIRGLDWLWHKYWDVSEREASETKGRHQPIENERELIETINELVKRWKKLRKEDPKRPLKTGDADPNGKEAIKLLKSATKIKAGPVASQTAANCLLKPKYMLSPLSNCIILWSPLLQAFSRTQKDLFAKLVDGCIQIVQDPDCLSKSPNSGQKISSADQVPIGLIKEIQDRARDWLLRLLKDWKAHSIDLPSLASKLSIGKDSRTTEIMQELSNIQGFDTTEPIARSTIENEGTVTPTKRSLDDLDREVAEFKRRSIATTIANNNEQSKIIGDDKELIATACNGQWRKYRTAKPEPIGFLGNPRKTPAIHDQ